MNVKVDNNNVKLTEKNDRIDLDVTLSWDVIWGAMYAIKEFFRFILPGGYKVPMRKLQPRQAEERPNQTLH